MKKVLPILLIALILVFALTACVKNNKTEDEVLPATTISVGTAEDLADIKNYLGAKYVNYTFTLTDNIDIASYEQWTPIGTQDKPFCATFDGNGKTISNLTYIGMKDDGMPSVTEKTPFVGLFGYVKAAKISNVTLTGVNMRLYSYGEYFHVAPLAAYSVGASEFKDINVRGRISLSNIYVYNTTYGLDGKVQDDRVVACDTTQYVGGLVAYSTGAGVFDNIDAALDISNNNYRAVYEKKTEEVSGETVVTEGYQVHSYSGASFLPRQTLAGILAGYIKSGASLDNITVSGSMEISAKSVYAASAAAILVGSEAKNITANNTVLVLRGSDKVGGAGSIALLDSSTASDMTVSNVTLTAQPVGGSIKSVSIGAFVSYCYDLAVLNDNTATDFKVNTSEKDKLQLGGVVGVVRDATVYGNTVSGTYNVTTGSLRVEAENYNNTSAVVYAAYGNATVRDNSADIDITLKNTVVYTEKMTRVYVVVDNTLYVNEDGKSVGRFSKPDNTKDYVEVFVKHENEGEITAVYNDSEGRELGQVTFAVNESAYPADGEAWQRFFGAYYAESEGLLAADGTVLNLNGKSFAGFKLVTGTPELNNNTTVTE